MTSAAAFLRSLLGVLLYPFFLAGISILFIIQNFIFNRRNFDDAFLQTWGRISCRMFGVQAKLYGEENLPSGGCIFLFNHKSFFDIFAMAAVIPGLRFGAKVELFKIPFFGMAMRRIGALPIDRKRKEKVFELYKQSEERLARGEKFALAPEGGRSAGDGLGQFKAGPFVFAINAKADLVPVVIRGAAEILPKGEMIPNRRYWQQAVSIQVLSAFQTRDLKIVDRPVLQQQIYQAMEHELSSAASPDLLLE